MIEAKFDDLLAAKPATPREASNACSGFIVRGGIVILAMILWILPFGTFSDFPSTITVWASAGFLLCLTLQAFRESTKNNENPWLAPASLLAIFYFVKYGFGSLVVYYWQRLDWQIFPEMGLLFSGASMEDALPNACQLIVLGGIGLYLGTYLPTDPILKIFPSLKWPIDQSRFHHNLVLYAPIAVIIYVSARWLPTTIRFTVYLLGAIAWVLVIIVAYNLFHDSQASRWKWVMVLLCMMSPFVAMFLMTGMREHIIKPIVLTGFGYVLARGHPPWKFVLPIFLIFAVILSPWLSIYKHLAGSIHKDDQGIVERIELVNEEIIHIPAEGILELAFSGVLARFAPQPFFVATYSSYYPHVYPFERGHTFALELESMIPRVLWPEKPNLSAELNRYAAAVGITAESDQDDENVTTAVFDAVSEYYVNFGATGVLLLSILTGYYQRLLYELLLSRSNLAIGGSIYLTSFLMNHDFFGVVQMFVSHTRQIPVWLCILYLMSRKR